ncbi:hypothetical protein QJS04_geneDACA013451 [Acorus gramineus]|uniref:Uncharacterized protein n=1 Tax=Acorus gramineus TaxID=55184 RepID=A0AAV9AGF2_ACOGR|nr:hypothetical protein QJS04_geneDACA013451 [Acorus gramineus]
METLVEEVRVNGESQAEGAPLGNDSSSTSQEQISDPVVYKLVRVEGDGRLVPATDDELMEVENMLEDDKSELHITDDLKHPERCVSVEESSSKKTDLVGLEDVPQSEDTDASERKMNARLEYIEVMLQKVKHEERLRLACESPDQSSKYANMDEQSLRQHDHLPVNDEEFVSEKSSQEIAPPILRGSEDSKAKLNDTEKFQEFADDITAGGSSVTQNSTSSKPDCSTSSDMICIDNLSIRELQETFKATFGRETSAKDKLWLKRRIIMGLTNSCNVPQTTFMVKRKYLLENNVGGTHSGSENSKSEVGCMPTAETNNTEYANELDSPAKLSNHREDQQVAFGMTLRKPKEPYNVKSEDIHLEQVKRARKPTRRYIEELSEAETKEFSGSMIPYIRNSGHGQASPKSRVQPVQHVGSEGRVFVTRQDSLGGSGVKIPRVSRVRRGRPRQNFMALLNYHPSDTDAKLVERAHNVHFSQHDSESGKKSWENRELALKLPQLDVADTGEEKGSQEESDFEMDHALEPSKCDTSGENSDDNIDSVPTTKVGTRRKHHRAWTLSEVVKLVEGVSRYGAGRWSEIKKVSFAPYAYRTSVDLKDKWRNLLRASLLPSSPDKGGSISRKPATMSIPAPILIRVRELAQMQGQSGCDRSSIKFSNRGLRSVHETRSGFL